MGFKSGLRKGMRTGKALGARASSSSTENAKYSPIEYGRIPTEHGHRHSCKSTLGLLTQPDASTTRVLENNIDWETLSIEGALHRMELSEKQLSVENYISICQKCKKEKNLGFAKRLYMHVRDVGLEDHGLLGNHLVLVFVECGSMCDARQLFNKLVYRTERCWTSLIQGYVECGESQHALNLFQKMQQDPAHCSRYAITATLRACSRLKYLEQGQGIHAKIAEEGLETDQILSNTLVDMYCKCGLLADAQTVFDKSPVRDVVSWNAVIAGFAEHGLDKHLQDCLVQMRLEGVSPDPVTFLCILKACGSRGGINKSLEMHTEIVKEGFERVFFVGNNLVHMYAKLGFVAEARQVLDQLPARNVVSWTTLIAGYALYGHVEDALNCLEHMQRDGVSPNDATYVCTLKACGSMGGIARGRKLHAEIAKEGFERHLFVGNALVDMYTKGSSLVEARKVFDQLPTQDVVSWTALLAGHAENGLCKEALNCLQQMQVEGVSPNATTFLCSLKACHRIGALDKGQEIHAEVAKEGFEGDAFIGNTLVDMYGSFGLLVEAREVFDQLPVRNVVSWNSLIAGYAEHGDAEDTLNCLRQMESEGVIPNAATFICSLKACGSLSALSRGREIHILVIKEGFEGGLFFGNSLVDMYVKCGLLIEAQKVFDELRDRDVVSWTSLIAGYGDFGLGVEALNCFERMQKEGVAPNAPTFAIILKACKSLGAVDRGCEMHAKVIKGGFERDPFVANALVDMYAMHGSLAEAQEVFDQLQGQTVVLWTTLIAGYAEHGLGEKALTSLEQMQLKGVSPDATAYVCTLKACGNIGAIDKGQELYIELTKVGFIGDASPCSLVDFEVNFGKSTESHRIFGLEPTELILHNVLVDMYCKCGRMADAHKVFDAAPTRDLVTWNALISGYALQGEPAFSLLLFDRMKGKGIQPDAVTYVSVLIACNHVGLVDKGQIYFEEMSKEYGLQPTLEHYNCMVDLAARAGQLNEAVAILGNMPFRPDVVSWITVLGACRKWGNVELGRYAFECVVRLDEKHLAAFVLISNIYLDAQMWEDAKEIEEMRAKIQTGIG